MDEGNDTPILSAYLLKKRFVFPGTEFCSWINVLYPSFLAL